MHLSVAIRRSGALVGPSLLALALACGGDPAGPVPAPPLEALIAFSYDTAGQPLRVGVMRPDGSERRLVTDGSANAWMPAWSPDGATLALSYQSVSTSNSRLHTMAPDGRALVEVVGGRTGYHPAWSPDGARIAFDDGHSLWLVEPDGAGLRTIEGLPLWAGGVTWSPDGEWIAFTGMYSVESGFSRRGLFVARPDGSDVRRVALSIAGVISHAAWSPDGTRLVFESEVGTPDARDDLWVLTVATDAVVRLTSTAAVESDPAWSPDGERIVFARRTGAWPQHIHTMRADGSDVRQLTTGDAYYASPSYRPASRVSAVHR